MFLNNKKGFTMLEMIIVIFVFLTGVVGVYSIIQNLYTTAVYSSNRLTATYLSQEGIELVKNLRDNNLISGVDWRAGIADGSYQIDYDDLVLSSGNDFLKKQTNGFYNYGVGSPTIFKRKITITDETSFINISVRTEWDKGYVIIEDNLYEYWK